jgi:Protein of unknown function (DUF2948)
MTDDDRLRLIALDAEDLAILSAHVQDAVLKVGDMSWISDEKRFVLPMNRFVWEAAAGGSWIKRDYQRRRSCLHFERVEGVKSAGIDRDAKESVLELLAVRFEPRETPSGDVLLDFAGGPSIRLAVECVEAQLADLGPAWSTDHAPRHVLR